MNHEALREQVIDLALGALEGREAREVEAHVAGCPECAAELASLRGTRAALAALPPPPAPARGEAVLLAAARQAAEASAERRRGRLPRWLWPAVLGAASATAAVLVSLRLSGEPGASRFDEGREALLGRAPAVATAEAPSAERAKGDGAPADRFAAAAPRQETQAAPQVRPARPAAAKKAEVAVLDEATAAAGAPPAAPPAAPAAAPTGGARGEIGIVGGAEPAQAPAALPASPRPVATPPAPARRAAPAPPAPPQEAVASRLAEPEAARADAAPPRALVAAERAEAKSARALQNEAPAPAPAPLRALAPASKGAGAPAAAPGCPGERTRTLRRDAAGRVVARERTGQLGGVEYRAEERFGEDGRLRGATLRLGGRVLELDAEALRAGGLEPYPGLRLAPTAAAAEADPPACAR